MYKKILDKPVLMCKSKLKCLIMWKSNQHTGNIWTTVKIQGHRADDYQQNTRKSNRLCFPAGFGTVLK